MKKLSQQDQQMEDLLLKTLAMSPQLVYDSEEGGSDMLGILRKDPELIIVGEVRDPKGIELALRAMSSTQTIMTTRHQDPQATELLLKAATSTKTVLDTRNQEP